MSFENINKAKVIEADPGFIRVKVNTDDFEISKNPDEEFKKTLATGKWEDFFPNNVADFSDSISNFTKNELVALGEHIDTAYAKNQKETQDKYWKELAAKHKVLDESGNPVLDSEGNEMNNVPLDVLLSGTEASVQAQELAGAPYVEFGKIIKTYLDKLA